MLDDDHKDNHSWWEERAALHSDTEMYREFIELLRSGEHSLRPTEVTELGDVSGKKLLHLQCHIGTDSLGWVRLGAEVTGVDFSETALETARGLAEELSLPLELVHSRVHDLQQVHHGEYDIVFTSYGTVPWFRDLDGWAKTIAHFLKPGGVFYIVDSHPSVNGMSFDSFDAACSARFDDPYFPSQRPLDYESAGTYAQDGVETQSNKTREWSHSLSEIVMSLLNVGLQIELLNEHAHCAFKVFDSMKKDAAGDYRLPPEHEGFVPLMFSLRARRPE